MAEKKKCNGKCGRSISPLQFYNTNSPLFSDGKVPFCKNCLKEMMPEDDLDAVKTVLRQIDKPFLIEVWKKAQASKNNTIGEYFRPINSLHQYRYLTWENSIFYDEDNSIVENEIAKANSETSESMDIEEVETEHGIIKVTKEMKSKWGNYPNRDILEMEKLYVEMERANDISTPQHKRQLFFYCKLTVLMDKALEEGDFAGYEKLSRQFDTLTKSSGFRPIDKKDTSNGIRTFSQIYEEVEKDGFIEPFPIMERQDIVDRTIQYLLNYQLKLLNQEQLHTPPQDIPQLKEDEEIKDVDE
jgi:hypothetical protein